MMTSRPWGWWSVYVAGLLRTAAGGGGGGGTTSMDFSDSLNSAYVALLEDI